ncbi:hypothetical protein QUA62_15220 [Microcoleus sp. MON1_C1]|uniref:hypothetical protein n=1 Tax=Microcoleus sp. MON1_C1 TaxID=2818827 RepID=UPI002FCECBCC
MRNASRLAQPPNTAAATRFLIPGAPVQILQASPLQPASAWKNPRSRGCEMRNFREKICAIAVPSADSE